MLGNPHFAAGTALLAWSLDAFTYGRGRAALLRAAVLGNLLGLSRPYDLVLLAGAHAAVVMLEEPLRRWPARLAPLLTLAPAGLANAAAFVARHEFASFGGTYVLPGLLAWTLALGPAVVLAAAGTLRPAGPDGAEARTAVRALVSWAALALLVLAVPWLSFRMQFVAGVGAPLLLLGARIRWTRVTAAAALLAVGSTVPTALALVTSENPRWYPPAERVEAGRVLRERCSRGDVVLAPPDIGLYALGLSACRPFTSHPAEPGHDVRLAETEAFYTALDPAARRHLLDARGVRHVVVPGPEEQAGSLWLGADAPYAAAAGWGPPERRWTLLTRRTLPAVRD
jgi:hypothetical protein